MSNRKRPATEEPSFENDIKGCNHKLQKLFHHYEEYNFEVDSLYSDDDTDYRDVELPTNLMLTNDSDNESEENDIESNSDNDDDMMELHETNVVFTKKDDEINNFFFEENNLLKADQEHSMDLMYQCEEDKEAFENELFENM